MEVDFNSIDFYLSVYNFRLHRFCTQYFFHFSVTDNCNLECPQLVVLS